MFLLKFFAAFLLTVPLGYAQGWGHKTVAKSSAEFTQTELALLLRWLWLIEKALPSSSGGPPPPPSLSRGANSGVELPILSPRQYAVQFDSIKVTKDRIETYILNRKYAFTVRRLGSQYAVEVLRDDGFKTKFESTTSKPSWKCSLWHERQWKNANPQFWEKGSIPDVTQISLARTANPIPALHAQIGSVGRDFKRQLAFQNLDLVMRRFFAEPIQLTTVETFLERWSSLAADLRSNKIAKEFAQEMASVGYVSALDVSLGIGARLDRILFPLEVHMTAKELRDFLSTDLKRLNELGLRNYGTTLVKHLDRLDTLGIGDSKKKRVFLLARNILLFLQKDTTTTLGDRAATALVFLADIRGELQVDQYLLQREQWHRILAELEAFRNDLLLPWEAVRRRAETEGMFERRLRSGF